MRPADLLITRALAVLSDVDPHHGEQLAAAGMVGVGTLAQLCFDAAPFFVPGRVAWGLAHTDPGTAEVRLPARAVSMWFSELMTVDVELAPGWLTARTHDRADGDRDTIPVDEAAETLAWRQLVQFPDRGHGDAAIFGAVLLSNDDGAPLDAVVWIVGHRFTGGARDDGWAFGAIPGVPSLSGWRDWWWSMCAIAAWGDWVPDQPVVVTNRAKQRRMAADGFDPGRLGLIRVLDSRRKVHPERTAGEGSHASPTEHLRRGHWHGQRVGPGRLEVETRWIAPTIVNPGFVLPDATYLHLSLRIATLGSVKINAASLKVIRERSGLSQAELSRRTGISQGHISQLEAGEKEPRPDTVKRLATALDCPTAALLTAVPA